MAESEERMEAEKKGSKERREERKAEVNVSERSANETARGCLVGT